MHNVLIGMVCTCAFISISHYFCTDIFDGYFAIFGVFSSICLLTVCIGTRMKSIQFTFHIRAEKKITTNICGYFIEESQMKTVSKTANSDNSLSIQSVIL